MKFLCVPGGLVDSPNDDILYEMQMHNTMQTIGPLDMQVGFTLDKSSMMAVVLHPLPGNIRDSMPKMDVSPQAFQHGVWIRGGIFPWNDMKASSPALHDIRVLTPTAKQPAILTSLGNILLMLEPERMMLNMGFFRCRPRCLGHGRNLNSHVMD